MVEMGGMGLVDYVLLTKDNTILYFIKKYNTNLISA